mgnify:CR=1 FL=1
MPTWILAQVSQPGIALTYQIPFPGPPPVLQLLLPSDSIVYLSERLEPKQVMHPIALRKSLNGSAPVFRKPSGEVVRYAAIEHRARTVLEEVDMVAVTIHPARLPQNCHAELGSASQRCHEVLQSSEILKRVQDDKRGGSEMAQGVEQWV